MKLTKLEYIARLTDWIMPKDPALLQLIGELRTLDGLYIGRSKRIHQLIHAAYCRGVKRGASIAWEAHQPVTLRDD